MPFLALWAKQVSLAKDRWCINHPGLAEQLTNPLQLQPSHFTCSSIPEKVGCISDPIRYILPNPHPWEPHDSKAENASL